MLTTDGNVKVMDFGIARATAVPSITQTSAVVGTAQYISPEQAQGMEADARSDIYSLGCCLYEMVTGQLPFTGPTPVAIAYRHMHEHPTPPRALNPDVPEPLERVCLRAMAKRPEDRYQTAVDFQQDLERVRAGAPAIAGIPLASRQTQALGATLGTPADAQTTVLDRGTAAIPGRAARYGGPGGGIGAPSRPRARRWRAPLLMLATLALTGIVAMMVVRAMEILPVPTTTLPPITTLPPNTSPATPTAAPTSTPESTTLSGGVTVPNVIGMRASRATETLQAAGLKVFRQESPSGSHRGSRVVSQLPPAGQQVPRDSNVVIVVGASDHKDEND
jgi:serine/threonine-protein kinase